MPESYEYANNGGRNYLLKNKGDGTFEDVTFTYGLNSTKWTLAAGAADLNGDGYPELVIANDYSFDEFYVNIEGKQLKGVEMGGWSYGAQFGDLNNNGMVDLYVANQNTKPLIYKNYVDTTNNWIDFDLHGTRSNRSAIGSKVELYWNGKVQVQVLTGGIGFSGQNQHKIHFGIGKSSVIEKVVIYWPSGLITTFEQPTFNQVHKIEEEPQS